jgi:hypothetical protein
MHATLERLEPRWRVPGERHDLAIEHERPLASLRECSNAGRDLGELV